MSERGSFVTEYVYCGDCFEVLSEVLAGDDKYLKSITVPSWSAGETLPIIAGKIGALASGGEVDGMGRLGAKISARICHPVRVAVLAEWGERIFTFEPKEKA